MIVTKNPATGTTSITVNGSELEALRKGSWYWTLYLLEVKRKEERCGDPNNLLTSEFRSKLHQSNQVSMGLGNGSVEDLLW